MREPNAHACAHLTQKTHTHTKYLRYCSRERMYAGSARVRVRRGRSNERTERIVNLQEIHITTEHTFFSSVLSLCSFLFSLAIL